MGESAGAVMKRTGIACVLLLGAGCGVQPLSDPIGCAEVGGCPEGVDDGQQAVEAPNAAMNGPWLPLEPTPPRSPAPEFDPLGLIEQGLDPLGLGIIDPADVPQLLSLWVDGLVLDLIDPAPTSELFTHLELLCRDRGLPETFCRRRYGP